MPIVYDIETFPNVFTLSAIGADSDDAATWEISERRNDIESLTAWLHRLATERIDMIGFGNTRFDYPVIHELLKSPATATPASLFQKAYSIIRSSDRFAHVVWERDRFIPQIDLFKIHHFDNIARSTSLKALQFNMRAPSVEDLPFEPNTMLRPDQIDTLCAYNIHDVLETKRFFNHSREAIEFRRYLTEKYQRDFMNHNDTKIGKDYFIMRLEAERPGSCYRDRQPVQTYRSEIRLRDVILPYIRFQHPEFVRVWSWLMGQTITDTRGALSDVSCAINGFEFHFGTGGIHGSVTRQHVKSDADHALIDLDVTSYYPSIAIVNGLYPLHLGELFCEIYADVMKQRVAYKKGSPENQMLKLALNGVYGDSNNPYSPFYDPQYTMSITINGQLLLCMLAEKLIAAVPDLMMVQINTDGLTIRINRKYEWIVKDVCEWWQKTTRLGLEETRYKEMFIRDVNNYFALSESGKIKRKGAYESAPPGERIPLGWHQDCSALVVPKAVEKVILTGADIETTIRDHRDPFDFMLRAKAPRGSHLTHGENPVQKTTRYYVALEGAPLFKISPPVEGGNVGWYKPARGVSHAKYVEWHNSHGNVWNPDIHTKNKSTYAIRKMQICAGWNVAICNRADAFSWNNVNFDWYIAEAKKLIDG